MRATQVEELLHSSAQQLFAACDDFTDKVCDDEFSAV